MKYPKSRLRADKRLSASRLPPVLLGAVLTLLSIAGTYAVSAQNTVSKNTQATQSKNRAAMLRVGNVLFHENAHWTEVAEVQTDELDTSFVASKGDGVILHKMQTDSKQGANLRSTQDYRDVHITLDFNLTKGSRSALYLLGRYRLNITDIYGSRNLWPSLMGGIDSRYDEEREWKNYDGVAASQNAAKAPGEWQTLEVEFKAPRFDENGFKTEYAQFISVKVNGIQVQDKAVATGPARYALAKDDAPEGPIAIMGGAGQIAIKNVTVTERDFSQVEAQKAVSDIDRLPLGPKSGKPMINIVALGKKVFADKGCKECHEINPKAQFVKTGPMLFDVFAPSAKLLTVFDAAENHVTQLKAEKAYLVDSLRSPTKHLAMRVEQDGSTKQFLPIMPAFNADALSENETNALYTYLLSLNSGSNVGEQFVWQEKPEKPYILSEDPNAELIADTPRLVRVNIGDSVSGRAYHVGLPNHMNYSFDPRTLAVEMVWSGRYLNMKNEKQGRADAPSEPGKLAKIWTPSVLSALFQPVLHDGQKVDFSFREPPKVTGKLSQRLLKHETDFLTEIGKTPAAFIGVDTYPGQIPVFHYQVNDNTVAMQLNINQHKALMGRFDFTNLSPVKLNLADSKLTDIEVSVGSIEQGVWTIPVGEYSQVTFKANVPQAPDYMAMQDDPEFSQANVPQPITWTRARSEQLSLPKGYTLEHGSVPKDTFGRDILFEPLGIAFDSKGDTYVSTRTAGVWKVTSGHWQQFAEGVFGSLGLVLDDDNTIVIGEKPGLTRLIDADKDGWAERRENVADQFRFNSNYHEYLHGPAKTPDGGYLFTLNLGHGLPGGYAADGSMSTSGGFRGWAMHVDNKGRIRPLASGLRSPAGLAVDSKGDAYYTDNQGDFFGTSKLIRLKENAYYGHPAGLVDKPNMVIGHPDISFDNTKAKRELALALLPHARAMNSPGSPIWDETEGKFGPYAGQMFVGDQSQSNIFRVYTESVDGVEQAALLPFAAGTASGVMRLTFSPRDNSLWVGQTGRGWWAKGGNLTGLQRIVWDNETVPQSMHSISVRQDGFVVRFTQAVPPEQRPSFDKLSLSSWYYVEDASYGSKERGMREESVKHLAWSDNGQALHIKLAQFGLDERADVTHTSRIYELDLSNTDFANELDSFQSKAWYTLNAIPK